MNIAYFDPEGKNVKEIINYGDKLFNGSENEKLKARELYQSALEKVPNNQEENKPYICPLALPTDDIEPEHFKAFYCEGSKGLYIHPNIWHEGVFPITEKQSFQGKQGKVHARVSIDLKEEFNKYIYFKTNI